MIVGNKFPKRSDDVEKTKEIICQDRNKYSEGPATES